MIKREQFGKVLLLVHIPTKCISFIHLTLFPIHFLFRLLSPCFIQSSHSLSRCVVTFIFAFYLFLFFSFAPIFIATFALGLLHIMWIEHTKYNFRHLLIYFFFFYFLSLIRWWFESMSIGKWVLVIGGPIFAWVPFCNGIFVCSWFFNFFFILASVRTNTVVMKLQNSLEHMKFHYWSL